MSKDKEYKTLNNRYAMLKEELNAAKNELYQKNKLVSELKTAQTINVEKLAGSINNTNNNIAEMEQLKKKVKSLQEKNKKLNYSVNDLNRQLILDDIEPTVESEKQHLTKEEIIVLNNKIAYLRQLAEKAVVAEENEKALKFYEELCKLDSNDIDFFKKTGMLSLQLGDYIKAKFYLEKVNEKNKNDIDVLMALGFCYLNSSNLYRALAVFSEAAGLEKNNSELYSYLGIVCSELGWYDAAAENFEKAMKIRPDSAETAYNLAVVLLSCKPARNGEAKKWYEVALTYGIKPNPKLEKIFKE